MKEIVDNIIIIGYSASAVFRARQGRHVYYSISMAQPANREGARRFQCRASANREGARRFQGRVSAGEPWVGLGKREALGRSKAGLCAASATRAHRACARTCIFVTALVSHAPISYARRGSVSPPDPNERESRNARPARDAAARESSGASAVRRWRGEGGARLVEGISAR